jgi:phospholipase C
VDANGYGLRVPGLVISPYARKGYIDHQTLSFDAYVKFIEDDFLKGQRIDPKTDGRPDPRPDVREAATILGNLARDFDFEQKPRRPLLLPQHPVPARAPAPAPGLGKFVAGTITAVGSGTVGVQVTATGRHDANLLGQILSVAVTSDTAILVGGRRAAIDSIHVGDSATLRIRGAAGGFTATRIVVLRP